jgi:hypothetical protein
MLRYSSSSLVQNEMRRKYGSCYLEKMVCMLKLRPPCLIRGLLPPQLAELSSAFRSAFQIPDSPPSIAGLITEQRHRTWIQQYLAQGMGQPQARTA